MNSLWKSSGEIIDRLLTRPTANAIDGLRSQVDALRVRLDVPVGKDQAPGRSVPYCFSRIMGPYTPITSVRTADAGYQALAPLADPGTYFLPRNGNIRVGQIGTFVCHSISANAYMTLTYTEDTTISGTAVAAKVGDGDIFDPAIEQNGGALLCNGFGSRFAFELGLYDKTRGRYLHDGDRLPSALFAGIPVAHRKVPSLSRFDPNTEIEPRLYLNQVTSEILTTDTIYNNANLKFYLFLTFKGVLNQDQPYGRR